MTIQTFLWFLYILFGIALGIALVLGILWPISRKEKPLPRYRKQADTSTATVSSTAPGSPTPAPVATTKKNGWMWLIIGILAAIIAYYTVLPALQKSAPAPQATAPKKELHKYTVRRPFEFLGGENFTRGSNYIGILKGGYANFRVNLPVVKNGKYKIYYHGRRVREGRDLLEINRGKGNSGMPFGIDHRATDIPIELVFFDSGYDIGMPGDAKYFRTGDNFLKLWADDDLLVQMDQPPYVEITYWE